MQEERDKVKEKDRVIKDQEVKIKQQMAGGSVVVKEVVKEVIKEVQVQAKEPEKIVVNDDSGVKIL